MMKNVSDAAAMNEWNKASWKQSSVTFCGMILSIMITCLTLLQAAADQSGTQLSMITHSFRVSLDRSAIDDRVTLLSPADTSAVHTTQRTNDVSARIQSLYSGKLRNHGIPADAQNEFGESYPQSNAFANLRSELLRFCQVSEVKHQAGEFVIDFLATDISADENTASLMADAIRQIRESVPYSGAEFEVICWANSSTRASFSQAVLKASRLQSSIRLAGSESVPPVVSSCGRIWTSASAMRPVASLVVRKYQERPSVSAE